MSSHLYTNIARRQTREQDEAEERARALGARDGAAEVLDVLNEQGRDVVIATLRPGHLAWDEAAQNAGAHRIAGIPDEDRAAYYEAYERAARMAAEKIRDEAAR